jgi:hypothetical protein
MDYSDRATRPLQTGKGRANTLSITNDSGDLLVTVTYDFSQSLNTVRVSNLAGSDNTSPMQLTRS